LKLTRGESFTASARFTTGRTKKKFIARRFGSRRERAGRRLRLQINGENVTADRDIYQYLRNRADNPVSLTINSTPSLTGARQISYRPITDEGNLIYLDWVNANRSRVEQMTGGRVGYIHVPDMGANGIREFIKWYYPQLDKEGLVVDVRANGGGNVSRMLIERLRRKTLGLIIFARTITRRLIPTVPRRTRWSAI
jgi:tricorn protease